MPKIAPTSPLYSQFRADFPAQAGEGITGDLNYSDTIIPIVDMTASAGTGTLPVNLQTAWDFSTGTSSQINAGTGTAISNTGFWLVGVRASINFSGANPQVADLELFDGTTTKTIWRIQDRISNISEEFLINDQITVFLRAGDSLRMVCDANAAITVNYRQIATVNGTLVNPLGFSFN